MSNINATLQSNLVLPVVDNLPASGTVGTQFVYQNNVYVFDSGGLPVRVGLDFAQATFVPTFSVENGTITTTDSLTVTKIDNLVTITGDVTVTVSGEPFDAVTASAIPVGYRPDSRVLISIIRNGNDFFSALIKPTEIQTNGSILISTDASDVANLEILSFIGSWTV
jgi:hypothetical protein